MRIQRIELDGFGRLEGFSEELADGLHIFFGPNEAGKSTLQQAILALLYGFYETDRARHKESIIQDRHEPWSGVAYRGRLEYELADGRNFRIDRDFSTTDVETRVHELSAGGRDVTDEYGRGRHGNLDFARKHLGMPKAVFEACAFLSQGELFDIQEKAKAIGDTIISLADTAGRDVSAQSALAQLAEVLREQVGGPNARTKPLFIAQRRLEGLERELAEIDAVRGQIAEDASARDEALARAEELRGELLRPRYLLCVAQAEEARQKLAQLDALTQQEEEGQAATAEHEAYARFPVEQRDHVQGEWARIQETEERLTDERATVKEQRSRIEELGRQRESLALEQRELAHLREFPKELLRDVDDLMSDWRVARTRANDAQASLDAVGDIDESLRDFESLDTRVGSLTENDLQRLYDRLSARGGGGLLAAIGRFFGLILRLITRLFGGDQGSADAGESTAASREDAERLLAERDRWSALRPRVERFRNASAAFDSAQTALQDKERVLREALRDVVDDSSDVERAYHVFLQRGHGAERLGQLNAQIVTLDREVATLATTVGRFEQDERQVQSRRTALSEMLRELTGRAGSLGELLAAFDDGCRRRRAYDDAARDLDGTREQRGILLGGRSPEELRQQLTEREGEATQVISEAPSLQGATTHEPPRELSQRIGEIDDDLRAIELRIKGLTTRIDTEMGKLRPRAEVEEEFEGKRRTVESLERFRVELEIATSAINEAAEEAHRDFAPHVGRFLSEHMAQVTAGRYCDVHLDPRTLELRVEVPETRRLEEIEKLSRGTRAGAYLLLRIGLAQHMSSIHEPVPLILDDPLVDLDDTRMEHFLDLLLELAADVQILLFTKDEAIRTWFERHYEGGAPHSLTVLQQPVESTDDSSTVPESVPVNGSDEPA